MACREFASDYARLAFAQELQYNLNQERVIAFRSVRIEVVNATNSYIEYKVVDDGGLPWLSGAR